MLSLKTMVIIIKPPQQSNYSHHTLPGTTIHSVLTLKSSKAALLPIANTLSMVQIYGK